MGEGKGGEEGKNGRGWLKSVYWKRVLLKESGLD